jgi:hypothetical protein
VSSSLARLLTHSTRAYPLAVVVVVLPLVLVLWQVLVVQLG